MKKRLEHHIYGKGETIVFLHGFLGDSTIWDDFVTHFEESYKVLTIDLPGHGKSPLDEDIVLMSGIAQKVHDLFNENGIKKAHMVGHSMGGYVCLSLAKLFPESVLSLTLFNSTAKADSEQKKEDRLRAVKVFDLNPTIFVEEAIKNLFHKENIERFPEEVEKLVKIAKSTSIKGAQACLKGMREREDMTEWLSKHPIPIHYIAGMHDNTVIYESIQEQIPKTKAKLTTLKNSGHMGFVEEKAICLKAITTFLNELKTTVVPADRIDLSKDR